MKIRYITPFSTEKNIGKAYNEAISELPDDCYVVLRDGDTMFLTPDWGNKIESIIKANPDYDIITCLTNRISHKDCLVDGDFNNDEMILHIESSKYLWSQYETEVFDTDIAPGMLMIFHKSVWQKHRFLEKSITFDKKFSQSVIKLGGKIGVARGLYIYHLYRMTAKKNPQNYVSHLL